MNVTLIILGYFVEFVGGVAALLLGLSFAGGEWNQYPFLQGLDDQRPLLLSITIVSLVLKLIINLAKDVPAAFETVNTPNGQVVKATLSGFEQELDDAADEIKKKVQEYFEAGERDFANEQYAQAASNYKVSFELLPTMAASLNAGNTFLNISDYQEAEELYQQGLRLAQQKADKKYEAAFLGNIGVIYKNQGKLDEALKYHQQSLEIHKAIGNKLGQANQLGNIGNIYYLKGKLDEALKYQQQALEIDKAIGNKLGQANQLGNIGLIYKNQGKLDEALKYHQQALAIDKAIGYKLGEAQDLGNIGNVYFLKEKLDDALNYYTKAHAMFQEIGATIELKNTEDNIQIIKQQAAATKP